MALESSHQEETKTLETWHEEESQVKKLYLRAFNKTWWIREDRIQNSAFFKALFKCGDEIPDVELLFSTTQEVYHVLYWVNRECLASPCPLSLIKCLELAKKFLIAKIIPIIEKEMLLCWELCSVYSSPYGCAMHIIAAYETEEIAKNAMREYYSKHPIKNPYFYYCVQKRDDSKPYDSIQKGTIIAL